LTVSLLAYKANSSIRVLSSTWTSGTINGRPEVVAFGSTTATIGIFERSINYFLAIWPALVFGILIGAAVRAFISPDWFARLTKRGSLKTQLAAGLAGTPLMLCSCCVAPVFTSVAETSVRLGPAIGLMLASPALNPLALPTFLELPLALSLLAAGFPAGAAVAFLFAGPAVNLPSLLNVARLTGWKPAALITILVWGLAVIGGLLVG